jgi:ribosome maturation factor RimP
MELSKYVGKYVKIELKNGYFYKGKILGVHESFISIKDINNKFVDISIDAISYVVEVGK